MLMYLSPNLLDLVSILVLILYGHPLAAALSDFIA
jgi:hypothetical protein